MMKTEKEIIQKMLSITKDIDRRLDMMLPIKQLQKQREILAWTIRSLKDVNIAQKNYDIAVKLWK